MIKTCEECFAEIKAENMERHENWHEDLAGLVLRLHGRVRDVENKVIGPIA